MTALPVRLRPGRREDIDAIVALDRATEFAPHWPVALYEEIVDVARPGAKLSPRRCLIVAECGLADESRPPVAGFAVGLGPLAGSTGEEGSCIAELEDVVVAEDRRRGGIGRALCGAVVEWCKLQGATEVVLEVRAGNAGAIALYGQLGFVQLGFRPKYYRDPDDDAIAMRLSL